MHQNPWTNHILMRIRNIQERVGWGKMFCAIGYVLFFQFLNDLIEALYLFVGEILRSSQSGEGLNLD